MVLFFEWASIFLECYLVVWRHLSIGIVIKCLLPICRWKLWRALTWLLIKRLLCVIKIWFPLWIAIINLRTIWHLLTYKIRIRRNHWFFLYCLFSKYIYSASKFRVSFALNWCKSTVFILWIQQNTSIWAIRETIIN